MSRELYQARSRKVQKLGRDGLVEQDRATGEERRVSQKETEISFGNSRSADRVSANDKRSAPAPERGTQSRTARKQQQRQQRQEQREPEEIHSPLPADENWTTAYMPDAVLPDALPQDAASMRGAVDMPMFAPPSTEPERNTVRPVNRRLKGTEKGRKPLGRDSGERLKPDVEGGKAERREQPVMRGIGDVRLAPRDGQHPAEGRLKGGNRLQFGDAQGREPIKSDPRTALKKRQTKQLAADAAKPEISEAAAPGPAGVGKEHTVSKLRFKAEREIHADEGERQEQAGETAAADGALAASVLVRAAARLKRPARRKGLDGGRLQFHRGKDEKRDSTERSGGGTGAAQKRQSTRHAPDAAKPENPRREDGDSTDSPSSPVRRPSDHEGSPRLHFEHEADGTARQIDSGAGERKRQTQRFAPEAAKAGTEKPGGPRQEGRRGNASPVPEAPPPVRDLSRHGDGQRLRFGARAKQGSPAEKREAASREKNRQTQRFAPEAAKAGTEKSEGLRQEGRGKVSPVPEAPPPVRDPSRRGDGQRLRFEARAEQGSLVEKREAASREKNRQTQRFAPGAAKAGTEKPEGPRQEDRRGNASPVPEAHPPVRKTAGGETGRHLRFEHEERPDVPAEKREAASKERNRQTQKFTPEAARVGTEQPDIPRREGRRGNGPPTPRAEQAEAERKRETRYSGGRGDAPHAPVSAAIDRKKPSDSGTRQRLRFEKEPEQDSYAQRNRAAPGEKRQPARKYTPETAEEIDRERTQAEKQAEQISPDALRQEESPRPTEDEQKETERDSGENAANSGTETVPSREPPKGNDAQTPQKKSRLRFEDERPNASAAPGEKTEKPTREQRQYEKAERRVEQASRKLEKAQSKIPVQRRIRLEKEYDSASGKVRHRLRFETEPVPQGVSSGGPLRAAAFSARTTAVLKLHGKIREVERDNVGVEAAHKGEIIAEQGGAAFLRWNHARLRSRPYRAVQMAERKLEREKAELEWKKVLRDNPELRRKNALSKWIQKQKIKRKYAQAAHEAKQTEQHTRNILNATGQIARAAAQFIAAKKSLLATVALLGLIVLLFSTGLVSCTAMLSGLQSSYISVSYMADEEDICDADLYYTEMETDLQIDIDSTQTNHPGYDEYRYNVGEIGHSPFELLSYLSTKYNAFKFRSIKSDIESLFWEQYTLTRTVVVETRYDSDGDPYDWYVLVTTLTVRPLSSLISGKLDAGEETTRYGLYMQTYGDRQAFGNPFDFPWLGRIGSLYGFRKHPMTGAKNLHRGVDIGAPSGTEIRAIQDGRVVSAGENGSYGLCVVIEGEKGYSSLYAHCSRLDVHAGQRVERGDVIAAVGSTGDSTGPHLHLETKLNGEYLNPIFFVETGGAGGAGPGGGVVIPAYPGEAPTDETYARMLAEAEKYLGYPYVWGGSSPATSFDCSGFVSWVINHSGWNVGRLGAQALCNLCTPVSVEDARPGDLVFFRYTYSAPIPDGVTHCGIYVGNMQMIHCGNPISYTDLTSSYWQAHFYCFGRLPTP